MELKSLFDVSQMSFAKGFDGTNVRVILGKGRSACVATFTGMFNGSTYYHIRELRDNYGDWAPGKGLSVKAEDKKELLRQLALEYVAMSTPAERIAFVALIENMKD